jgi:hypothetical protein
MGGACSAYGGRGEVHTEFWWRNMRERDRLEDPGVYGKIILRWVFDKWDVEAQNREKRRALVNAVMNFRVP